ncbi:virion structural protein [Cellulophaga phage Ingeline_1]|uniref:Structural protein n=1 Tax=Cellulophaga phage Ingeline_1 TaxID=2745674 RepID=A0A8E4ZL56_9CAUD|nr:virion structural protein [Cellulophaga phage Ingeline_1]QQV90007.1 structural protein [Cellulophaga phage Ingeline_2]QQV90057.1 structural protein [Cellulophaga phage Ingeline_3]QQV90107.1 structural protein [Cellulophaga phage Ingeline_4]QQV90157.1 structural protein [Cellulophaga phage Ingeline_5]QQV90206.1 structural protein [Cellulophaga phage Ingeline_6]QQV90256.1 structural protein [Cellulophaga phage Ingeline_7]QQV90324.1 structural protein [Cellulophaga phage Ingeline_8]
MKNIITILLLLCSTIAISQVKAKQVRVDAASEGIVAINVEDALIELNSKIGGSLDPADQTKLDNITVTQAVNLDDIESKANSALQTETDPNLTKINVEGLGISYTSLTDVPTGGSSSFADLTGSPSDNTQLANELNSKVSFDNTTANSVEIGIVGGNSSDNAYVLIDNSGGSGGSWGDGGGSSNYVIKGENTITSNFTVKNSDGAGLSITNGNGGATNISGGIFPSDRTELIVSSNSIEALGYSNADITALGDRAVITKSYADANYGGGGSGTGLENIVEDLTPELGGNLDADGFGISGLSGISTKSILFTQLNANIDIKSNISGDLTYFKTISNDSTYGNTSIGYSALGALYGYESLDRSTAVGAFALKSASQSDNTAMGYGSLSGVIDGVQNTAIGSESAMFGNTNSVTAIGYQAGSYIEGGVLKNNLSGSSNSVFIGALTRAKDSVSGQNQIVIGYRATGNGVNTVTIGNSSITENYFNGEILLNGVEQKKQTSGASRPLTPDIGDSHFDTALGYPIWYNGTNWVDSTGTTR